MGIGAVARGLVSGATAQQEGANQGLMQGRQLQLMAQQIAFENALKQAQAGEMEGRGELYRAQAGAQPTSFEQGLQRYTVPAYYRMLGQRYGANARGAAIQNAAVTHANAQMWSANRMAEARDAATRAHVSGNTPADRVRFIQSRVNEFQHAHVVRDADGLGGQHVEPGMPADQAMQQALEEWEALTTGKMPATPQNMTANADQWVPRSHQEIDERAQQALSALPPNAPPQAKTDIANATNQLHSQYRGLPFQTAGVNVPVSGGMGGGFSASTSTPSPIPHVPAPRFPYPAQEPDEEEPEEPDEEGPPATAPY